MALIFIIKDWILFNLALFIVSFFLALNINHDFFFYNLGFNLGLDYLRFNLIFLTLWIISLIILRRILLDYIGNELKSI